MLRDSTSCTSMSAVSTPTPITRANRRTIACGPSLGHRGYKAPENKAHLELRSLRINALGMTHWGKPRLAILTNGDHHVVSIVDCDRRSPRIGRSRSHGCRTTEL